MADWTESQFLSSKHPMKSQRDVHLSLGAYDLDFFYQTVISPSANLPRPEKPSHKRIVAALKTFDAQLAEASESRIKHLLLVVSEHLLFLYLIFPDAGDANEIFEILNDRGIGLSTEELVRGYLLQAVKADNLAATKVVDAWDSLFDLIAERRGRNFLRHYWISKNGDVKSRSLNRTIRNFINSSKSRAKKASELTDDMLDAASVYSDILSAEFSPEPIASRVETLVDLEALGTFPVLLSLFRTYSAKAGKERSSILTILNLLIIAFVRIRVIGQRQNSEFESLMFSIAPMVAEKKVEEVIRNVKKIVPTDAEFKLAFERASVKQARQAHYLLRRLEESANSPSTNAIAPSRDATLEHVYARKATDRLSAHDEWINRLGNLTLLGGSSNSSIQNATFAKKRPLLLTSPFWLNQTVCKFKTWDEKSITARQRDMAQIAMKVWSFEDLDSARIRR